jgi:hypothetical protein
MKPLLALIVFAAALSGHEERLNIASVDAPSGVVAGFGFDVTIHGMLPNSCYHFERAEILFDRTTAPPRLDIRAIAHVSEGLCLMVLTPYSAVVHFGPVPAGENVLRFLNADGSSFERRLFVR